MASETSEVVRKAFERLCTEFTGVIAPRQFERVGRTVWSRSVMHTSDLIHLHREGSTYGAPRNFSVGIRMHFGICVGDYESRSTRLNGPFSDAALSRAGRFHLRFNAQTGSTYDRCFADLVRFLDEVGEPWFGRFRSREALLHAPDSPLNADEKTLLSVNYPGGAESPA